MPILKGKKPGAAEEKKPLVATTKKIIKDKHQFLFISEFGETLGLALAVKNAGHTVRMMITESEYKNVGDGLIDKENDWFEYIGQGWIFVFDGCNDGARQDWLREQGEWVCGGSKATDDLENIRQQNQEWFKELGFKQPHSENFTDIDEAIQFVTRNKNKRWILKQNGDAPKSLNHMGKFKGNIDMIFHLQELKKGWNELQYGKFDCDLMEVVEADVEVAASAFWNGHDWLRNDDGKVVGYLNFEFKKLLNHDLGATTGETGTLFIGVDEDNEVFNHILMKTGIAEKLEETGFRGVFDINGCIKDGEFTGFEPTSRWGVPAVDYEAAEGLNSDPGELIAAMAKGEDTPIDIHMGLGMVMVVYGPPFPVETDMDETATSLGERLWIMEDKEPVDEMTDDHKKHIHLYNFQMKENKETGEKYYAVATKHGYLLTVTCREGECVEDLRENLIHYIKENVYISDIGYRTDIGERVREFVEELGYC